MEPKRYYFVSGTYNAEKYIKRCIESVRRQDVPAGIVVKHIIINDGSTDGTLAVIEESMHENVILINKAQREWMIASQLTGFKAAEVDGASKWDVICQLDGDDSLRLAQTVSLLHGVYIKGASATYGNYVATDMSKSCCRPLPSMKAPRDFAREVGWPFSHLRTFRLGLASRLREDDLKDEDGEHYKAAQDVAVFLPIAEMAGHGLVFTDIPFVRYNKENPIRDGKLRYFDQARIARDVYLKPKYEAVIL